MTFSHADSCGLKKIIHVPEDSSCLIPGMFRHHLNAETITAPMVAMVEPMLIHMEAFCAALL